MLYPSNSSPSALITPVSLEEHSPWQMTATALEAASYTHVCVRECVGALVSPLVRHVTKASVCLNDCVDPSRKETDIRTLMSSTPARRTPVASLVMSRGWGPSVRMGARPPPVVVIYADEEKEAVAGEERGRDGGRRKAVSVLVDDARAGRTSSGSSRSSGGGMHLCVCVSVTSCPVGYAILSLLIGQPGFDCHTLLEPDPNRKPRRSKC